MNFERRIISAVSTIKSPRNIAKQPRTLTVASVDLFKSESLISGGLFEIVPISLLSLWYGYLSFTD